MFRARNSKLTWEALRRIQDASPDLNALLNPIFRDAGEADRLGVEFEDRWSGRLYVEAQIFGFGHLFAPWRPRFDDAAMFIATPFDIHMGCRRLIDDADDPDGDGFSQCRIGSASVPDAPEGSGGQARPTELAWMIRMGRILREITEGELDLASGIAEPSSAGRGQIYCGSEAWRKIICGDSLCDCMCGLAFEQRHRRFFDLDVAWNDTTNDWKESQSNSGAFTVRRLQHFKYHDLGKDFEQMQF